jgi:hypothetical protein
MSDTAEIIRLNFEDGNWDDSCSFCGNKQLDHRVLQGPSGGVQFEYREPCKPEKNKMRREQVQRVRMINAIVFLCYVAVPLLIILLQQFWAVLGWVAFAYSIFRLGIKCVELFGNADKWIPGHKEKNKKESDERHWIHHCRKNPDGFLRLKLENFEREQKEREMKLVETSNAGH